MADGPRVTGPEAPADGAGDAPAGPDDPTCQAHPGAAAELRALAFTALDRLEPVLQRLRVGPPTPNSRSCPGCPVCAVLALLRGERPELAVQLADQLSGMLAVLRAALEEGDPAGTGAEADPSGAPAPGGPSGRRVQHIHVERRA